MPDGPNKIGFRIQHEDKRRVLTIGVDVVLSCTNVEFGGCRLDQSGLVLKAWPISDHCPAGEGAGTIKCCRGALLNVCVSSKKNLRVFRAPGAKFGV